MIESNFATAKLWGLFTPGNCDRLKRGGAAMITKGSYVGQIVEVDHIVQLARYPQFANELTKPSPILFTRKVLRMLGNPVTDAFGYIASERRQAPQRS